MGNPDCPGCQALTRLVAAQAQRLEILEARIAELESQLRASSQNSSKPPSSDPPGVKRAPPRLRGQRPAGGQPGHARCQRPVLPADKVVSLSPAHCRGCGSTLAGKDPHPLRHQVLELPPGRPHVTEYHRHRLRCRGCGLTTCAVLPGGVPAGGQGPRLQALIALLTGTYRLSKRMVQSFCRDVFGIPLSLGQVCAVEAEVAAATAPTVAALRAQVRCQPANVDETGWRLGKRRRGWLWVAVTSQATVFRVARHRSAAVAKRLVGVRNTQVLTSDRHSAYHWVDRHRRQVCWAHLRRDFQAMIDRGQGAAPIGRDLLFLADMLFACWYEVRDGTRSRRWFQGIVGSLVRPDVRGLLEDGRTCGHAKTAATCAALLDCEESLWTFARVEHVEPTNNAAERALRHAVMWRKTSYGTTSATGARFVENMLSLVATCRQQGQHVLDYLTACCQAALQQTLPPSLVPARA